MHRFRLGPFLLAAALIVVLVPAQAEAQAYFSPFVGYFYGDSIDAGAALIPRDFQSGVAWGARGGYFFGESGIVGVEIDFTQSSKADFSIAGTAIDARATYWMGDVIFRYPHQRYQPYGVVGFGLTRFRVSDIDAPTHTKIGYSFGGGVMLNFRDQPRGQWGLRFDIRDYYINLVADEGMRPGFRDKLLLPTGSETPVHNIVTSIAVHFAF